MSMGTNQLILGLCLGKSGERSKFSFAIGDENKQKNALKML